MSVVDRTAVTSDPDRDTKSVPWSMVIAAAIGAVVTIVYNLVLGTVSGPSGLFGSATDIEVYRAGAQQLWSGDAVYDGPLVTVGPLELLFTYTPFAAVVFLPLAALGSLGLDWVAYLGNAILIAAVIGLSMRLLGYRMSASCGCLMAAGSVALLSLEPVRTSFAAGQINLLLVALIISDIGRCSGRLRGVGVGLAAGIKLTPLIFVVYLLATRQWRTAATALATFAVTVVVGFVAMPVDACHYWTGKVMHSERIGVIDGMANQSVNGFVSQLLRLADAESYRDAGGAFVAPGWMWLPIAAVVGGAGIYAARVAHDQGRELLALSMVGMTGCAISPFSWGHHWVWIVPLLLVTMDHLWTTGTRPTWVWLAPAGLLGVTLAWPFPLSGGRGYDIGLFMMPRPEDPTWWQTIAFVVVCGSYLWLFVATVLAIGRSRRGAVTGGQLPR
uniref:glycosyltransferase 87 family protein n=1 Tax=Gordonia sp. B7-2 TaxID=3420932 RepID=UPI003D8CE023